jgi:hypothetical protein
MQLVFRTAASRVLKKDQIQLQLQYPKKHKKLKLTYGEKVLAKHY